MLTGLIFIPYELLGTTFLKIPNLAGLKFLVAELGVSLNV